MDGQVPGEHRQAGRLGKVPELGRRGDTSEGSSTQPLTLKLKEPNKGQVKLLSNDSLSSRGVSPFSTREKQKRTPEKITPKRESTRKGERKKQEILEGSESELPGTSRQEASVRSRVSTESRSNMGKECRK